MSALLIAKTALIRMARDRSNTFFVFILPFLIVLVLGAVFGRSYLSRVGILAESDGEYTQRLICELEADGTMDLERYDGAREEVILAVERGQLEAAIIFPDGFDEALGSGQSASVDFVVRPDQSAQGVANALDAAVTKVGQVPRTASFLADAGAAGYAEALDAADEVVGQASSIEVETRSAGEPVDFATIGRFDLGAYSQLTLFVFLTSMVGATALIESRRLGVARRMLATPTSLGAILAGEALGRVAVALAQGLLIMVGSSVIFGVGWGDWASSFVVLLVISVVAASLGMLAGAVFRTEQQAGGVGVMLGLGLAALGGCMLPLAIMEIFTPELYRLAHITPHAWAIEAFEDIIVHGGTVADALPELGVLAAYGAVLWALALWRFRRALTRA
ncbi:MAG: hypothetical protein Kow0056_12970 [Coriobacteriia bacterium]